MRTSIDKKLWKPHLLDEYIIWQIEKMERKNIEPTWNNYIKTKDFSYLFFKSSESTQNILKEKWNKMYAKNKKCN
jgi:hypothetical protein